MCKRLKNTSYKKFEARGELCYHHIWKYNWKELMEQRETMQDSTRLQLPRWDELPDISLYMDQVLSLINPHFQDTYGDSYLLTSTMVNN